MRQTTRDVAASNNAGQLIVGDRHVPDWSPSHLWRWLCSRPPGRPRVLGSGRVLHGGLLYSQVLPQDWGQFSFSGQFLIFIINNLARCVSLRGTGRSPPRDKRWSWRRRRTSVTQTGDVCDPFSGTRWNTPGPAPGPHYAISISCRI